MDRKERTNEKMQELFHTPAAGEEGTDPEFMQILQGYIFGDVCYTGSLDKRGWFLLKIPALLPKKGTGSPIYIQQYPHGPDPH